MKRLGFVVVLLLLLVLPVRAFAAEVGPVDFSEGGGRCTSGRAGGGVAVLKCWMNPAFLALDGDTGAAWGYDLSSWDAQHDLIEGTHGGSLRDGGYWSGTAWNACPGSSSTYTSHFHADNPTEIPSGGVVYVYSCSNGSASPVEADPADDLLGGGIFAPFQPGCADLPAGCPTFFKFTKWHWVGDVTDWESMPWPEDWYPGMPDPTTGSAGACTGVTITGPPGLVPVEAGDVAVFEVVWDGVALFQLDWRRDNVNIGGPAAVWRTIVGPQPIGVSKTVSITWPAFMDGFSPSDITFRCRTIQDDVIVDEYWQYGNGDGFGSDPIYHQPCFDVRVVWPPSRQYQAGSTVKFYVSVPGTVGSSGGPLERVEVSFIDPAEPVPPMAARDWELVEFTTGVTGDPITPFEANPVEPGFAGGFQVELPYDGDLFQLQLRCQSEDADGELQWDYAHQWSPSFKTVATPDVDCYDSANFGWAPSSWVPGILKGAACLFADLVVPSASDLEDFGSMWSTSWLGELFEPLESFVDGLTDLADIGSGTCAGPSIVLPLGPPDSAHIGHGYVYPAPVTVAPMDACDDEGVMSYVRTITLNCSRFAAMVWMLSRVRRLYFSLVAP